MKNTAAAMREKARKLIQKAEQIEAAEMQRIGRLAMAEYEAGRLEGTALANLIAGRDKHEK